MRASVLVFLLLVSCGNECDLSFHYNWGLNYKTDTNLITDSGIEVDSLGPIDLDLIDLKTKEVEDCLSNTFPGGELTGVPNGWCYGGKEVAPCLNRECIKVKIPDDWSWSCDGKEQLLKDIAPQGGCFQKGFENDDNCPCRWRANLQGNVIITTPNLKLYKEQVVKVMTGCDGVWENKKLSKCASN